jgi:hypothetical protein
MQLRILTLNIWGVHYMAKLIGQRIQALINHLLSPDANYDIIGLQEVSKNKRINILYYIFFIFNRYGVKLIMLTSAIKSNLSIPIVIIF